MSITRTYRTETECARCWINEDFEHIPDWLVTERQDLFDAWEFYGINDSDEYGYIDAPMWGTYFMPNTSLDTDWLEANAEAVARLGFTLIFHEGCLFAIGIDGAGYDFYEAHWVPLYRLRGFTWHRESA